MVTRRTTRRLFLLRPSPQINACIRYCLALAQRRAKVEIHSAVFMSNHYHLIVTDPEGQLPIFTEELNKLIARSLNCLHGRWENFWSSNEQTSHVSLASEHDVMAKTVYALSNPTAAFLVSSGEQWPGVRLFRKGLYLAKKPKFFFRTKDAGGLPDRLNLTLTPPPIGAREQVADDLVKAAVRARETELRAKAKHDGKTYLGAAAVKAQSIDSSPTKSAATRTMSPQVACKDKWHRLELLMRLKEFVVEHEEKRQAFLQGAFDVVFPRGTYRFVRHFGMQCGET